MNELTATQEQPAAVKPPGPRRVQVYVSIQEARLLKRIRQDIKARRSATLLIEARNDRISWRRVGEKEF